MAEKQIITSGQLFILLFICRTATIMLYPTAFTESGSVWGLFLPLMISAVFSLLILVPIIFYQKKITDEEIHFSSKGRKVISYIFLVYFSYMALYHLYRLTGFAAEMSPTSVSSYIVVLLFLIVAVYAAFKGLGSIVRFSAISFAAVILGAIMMIVFLIPSYSPDNLLPLRYFSNHTVYDGVMMLLSETVEIDLLIALCIFTKGNFLRTAVMWNIFQNLFLIFMLILVSGSVGEYLLNSPYPFFHAIDGSGVLQRFDPFYIGITLSALCCLLSAELYVIRHSLGYLAKEEKTEKRAFLILSGVLYAVLLFLSFHTAAANLVFDQRVVLAIVIRLAVLFPVSVLIVHYFKNRKSEKVSKRVIRTASLLLCVAIIFPMLCGCSAAQLNQRMIVQGIGIDRSGQHYTMTFITLDTESETRENAVKMIYADGNSVEETITDLEKQRGKSILLSQCLFLMLNKEAADHIDNSLSYFESNNDIMKTTNIMVSEKTAQTTLTAAIEKMGYQSEDINVLTDSNAVSQPTVHFSLFDYVSARNNPYYDMVMPYINIDKSTNSLTVKGSKLVSNDRKQHYLLNGEETVGVLMINQKAQNYTESLTNQNITYTIKALQSEIIPKIENDALSIRFDIITELQCSNQEKIQVVKEDMEQKINAAIQKTIKENGNDVMSIYRYVRSVYPRYRSNKEKVREMLKDSECQISLKIS
ncbi:MAG: GerAB/ArcD/ProY family transporter [Clostridia bacterium]|nr:GerAB/ArcD/ProY family transporter [Clostridia bacterium]